MKICIFSDIHGNGPAFHVAYDMIISEKADFNVFLGDLCGYYFDQQQIYEMILSLPHLIALQGNHDKIFLKIARGDKDLQRDYLRKYGCSMEHLLEDDNHGLRQWLLTLPETYIFADINLHCSHGSPWNPMEGYVYPDSPLKKFFDYSASIFLLGHTHYPMTRTINDKLIVNPGSLGQPRNGGWPTYALVEYPSKKVVYREVHYNKSELISRIDELDSNNKYLKEVLLR